MTARLLSCTSFHVLLSIYKVNLRKDSTSPIDFTQELLFSQERTFPCCHYLFFLPKHKA